MSEALAKTGRQNKQQVGTADLAFVAYVLILAAIAIVLTCAQIYMQNPT